MPGNDKHFNQARALPRAQNNLAANSLRQPSEDYPTMSLLAQDSSVLWPSYDRGGPAGHHPVQGGM